MAEGSCIGGMLLIGVQGDMGVDEDRPLFVGGVVVELGEGIDELGLSYGTGVGGSFDHFLQLSVLSEGYFGLDPGDDIRVHEEGFPHIRVVLFSFVGQFVVIPGDGIYALFLE